MCVCVVVFSALPWLERAFDEVKERRMHVSSNKKKTKAHASDASGSVEVQASYGRQELNIGKYRAHKRGISLILTYTQDISYVSLYWRCDKPVIITHYNNNYRMWVEESTIQISFDNVYMYSIQVNLDWSKWDWLQRTKVKWPHNPAGLNQK